MTNTRVVSGIRPTGDLHLGNYFGAIKQFIQLQNEYEDCFFFVADLHALTTAIEDKNDIEKQSIDVLRYYLACGVDPDKAMVYRQSDIPEIPYLALLLSMVAPEGEIRRTASFKEKSVQMEQRQQTVNLGLLTYPVLMAADILFCNGSIVPVGHDQLQHLEITREIARRYNSHFSDRLKLVEPQALKLQAIRVPGLGVASKMSKSGPDANRAVALSDTPKMVEKKVKAAQTDIGPEAPGGSISDASASIQSLYHLLKLCAPTSVYKDFEARYVNGEQKFYGALKTELATHINLVLEPIQERYKSPECSEERVRQLLLENSEQVRTVAAQTVMSVLADMRVNDLERQIL